MTLDRNLSALEQPVRHEHVWGSGGVASRIFSLGTRGMVDVPNTPLPKEYHPVFTGYQAGRARGRVCRYWL